jgi:hypothetical protein
MVQCSNRAHNMIGHSYGLINLGGWLFLLHGDLWSGYRTEWTVCVGAISGPNRAGNSKGLPPENR